MLKSIARTLVPAPLWARLRLARQRWRLDRFEPRVVQHVYGRVPLVIHLHDSLAEGWYDHDWPVLDEIELLADGRLREGAVVFDLGAHQGVVALMLAAQVGAAGRVIALEGNPHNSRIAELNRRSNKVENVTLVNAVVTDTPGTVGFSHDLNGRIVREAGRAGMVSTRAVTVDELAREHGVPDVVFVDVEGWECHVLRGAEETFRSRPDWFIEVHAGAGLEDAGSTVGQVLDFFRPDEYELVVSPEAREFRPVDRAALPEGRLYLVARARERESAQRSVAASTSSSPST
jgi:FkbM family methyltransferase